MLLIVYGTVPVLDNVTVWTALLVFTSCVGKVSEVADKVAIDCVPTPLSDMFNNGVTGSLLLIMSTVLRFPMADGLNVRLMVQLKPAPTPDP